MNCDTCRWWEKAPLHDWKAHGHDTSYGNTRQCACPAILRGYAVSPDEVPPNGALVENDEGWAIYTGPKFGCVQWEAK